MASIPSSGSLMATHNYHRRRLSSTSSNSSCGSSEYSGEVIPHPPGKCCLAWGCRQTAPSPSSPDLTGGLPKSDPGHWWASFFFGKTTHPAMTTVSESPERTEAPRQRAQLRALAVSGLAAAPHGGGHS
ncbi:PPDPF factor, partial [Eubucco bourcierii]|nr:PPDPF factor [Eubucco bourcierii]